jgi:TonB-linked SusC/RagA family outer membrane protein
MMKFMNFFQKYLSRFIDLQVINKKSGILKYNIILLFLLATFYSVSAQNRVINGTVKDPKGEVIIGANIYIENAQNRALAGTVTDLNGNYRVAVPNDKNLTITCSFIGYKMQKVVYTNQKTLNFVLEDDVKTLDQLDVVGKKSEKDGFGVSKREQTSSSQKFNMSDLESSPMTSITESMQGRLANVDIVTGGDPGSKSSIRIRGTSSLTASSDPLIVVDGIPYSTSINSDFNFSTASDEDLGALVNLNPNDIESIEVLKDAAATSIWGSAGVNGVLLFTTKKGTKGKTRFSLSSKFDYQKEPKPIPMLSGSQYVNLVEDAIWNTVNDLGSSSSESYLSLLYDTKEIAFDENWTYFDEYNQNTNWLNEVSQVGYTTDNSLSMSGGGEKATYMISLGYLKERGTTIGTGLKRLTSTAKVTYKFSDKLNITSNLQYLQSTTNASWSDGDIVDDDDLPSVRGMAMTKMPNMSPYYINDDGTRSSIYFTPESNFQGTFDSKYIYNPVAMVEEATNRTDTRTARVGFFLNYTIIQGLQYTGTLGLDIRTNKTHKYLPQCVTGVKMEDGYYNLGSDTYSDAIEYTTDNKLTFVKELAPKHKIVLLLDAKTDQSQSYAFKEVTNGNTASSLSDPISGSNPYKISSGNSMNRSLCYISNAHYSFNDRYMLDLGYRVEAKSNIGKNNRWVQLPTTSAAWIFSDESFLKSQSKWLTEGKFRVSWGISGNAPSKSYPSVGTVSPTTNYETYSAVLLSSMQLNNLKWEKVKQLNFGLDLFLFNKLNLTLDVYDKKTSDLLQKDYTVSEITGYSSVSYYNSGTLSNKGWELVLNYNALKNKNLDLSFNFNISRNENIVNELPKNKTYESYTFGNGNYAYRIVTGKPLGSFFGYKCLGVYQNEEDTYARDSNGNLMYDMNGNNVTVKNATLSVKPGDAKYQDLNGDGVINKYDITYLGNALPLYTGGAGFTLRYKNLTLSTFFHGRTGQSIVNSTRISNENMYGTNNQSTAVLHRWRYEGDDTNVPRALYGIGYNYLGSDRFVEKGDFIRLKTLSLTYKVPKLFTQKLNIDMLNIWATGYDLFTWTNYTGQDPEISVSTSNSYYLLAKDKSYTPKTRHFAIGITMNF